MLARGHGADFVLNMDLRSFNRLAEAADRNRRADLSVQLAVTATAAQGDGDGIKKFQRSLQTVETKAQTAQSDQRAFASRMKGAR